MKKFFLSITLFLTIAIMISADNVFFQPFKTTNGAIPFDRITTADYEPAIIEAMKRHSAEIDSIANQEASPTFENTIVALERSGQMLNRVLGVFYPMLSANADDSLMAVSERMTPLITEHGNSITLNEKLWQRIDYVYNHFDKSQYDNEDWMLLHNTHESFVRSGAALQGADREKYRELSTRLSQLTLKFDQNALKETARYEMWLKESDLEGLPESAVEAAAAAAKAKDREGEYLITLNAPSYMAFMKYSSRRDLREKLYKMYNSQCTSGEYNNIEIMQQIANTRLELANLLGYKTFAYYQLANKMAENPTNVYNMLNQLKDAYTGAQKRDMEALNKYASQLEGKKMTIMPWDYSYYSNKLKEEKYSINDELLRPYFKLENVIDGVFGLATRLYGLHFTENHDAQVFHPEVKVYNVTDDDGNFVALLYTDFFPRDTKQSGAWMTNFREQYRDADGNDVRPIVTLTMNFTRPTDTKPSLLTYYEVETFMHEFGHGLHGMLSKCKYASTSGTNVYRDFVELPSQFNENFLSEREYLDSFARHYLTGENIPQELVEKIKASEQYGAAYACLRQLSFGFLDMAYHTITKPVAGDAFKFEYEAMKPVEIFKPVDGCMMSPQFTHIFSGGYAAGYYGYKWAEILDADAFSKFQEDGIFNPATARSFKENILERGGTEPPMTLYKRFRGREPRIDALLKRDGIKK
ncbi:MAG: M3 family metallopeptidase [Muribaculaceae bacterium]|nr:M3 family metallopeptidase [Muribaculaceae bacterium]